MFDEKSYSLKMDKTIDVFSKELASLRTGRANSAMLDLVKVDVYGQQMPINQVGNIKNMKKSTFKKFVSMENFNDHLKLHKADCYNLLI